MLLEIELYYFFREEINQWNFYDFYYFFLDLRQAKYQHLFSTFEWLTFKWKYWTVQTGLFITLDLWMCESLVSKSPNKSSHPINSHVIDLTFQNILRCYTVWKLIWRRLVQNSLICLYLMSTVRYIWRVSLIFLSKFTIHNFFWRNFLLDLCGFHVHYLLVI